MQQHIQIYDPDGFTPCGLVNICNIEEVWLNICSWSVAIRYRSPNGRLIEHEEYYDSLKTARLRYSTIRDDMLDNPHHGFEVRLFESLKNRKKEMEENK